MIVVKHLSPIKHLDDFMLGRDNFRDWLYRELRRSIEYIKAGDAFRDSGMIYDDSDLWLREWAFEFDFSNIMWDVQIETSGREVLCEL